MVTLEERLGYSFTDATLLKTALTHPSALQGKKGANYERLELLGDAVLTLLITEELLVLHLEEPEGDIVKRRAALVNGTVLAEVAEELDLGAHLILSESEEQGGGRKNKRNLENAMEALIGAIYQDAGMERTRMFIRECFAARIKEQPHPPQDAKTKLQEWAQGRGLDLPVYTETARSGPSHAPEFTVQVEVQGQPPASAKAGSKRLAEREAAEIMLKNIGNI